MLGVVMGIVVLLCVDMLSILSIYNILRILRLDVVMLRDFTLGVIMFSVYILFYNMLCQLAVSFC